MNHAIRFALAGTVLLTAALAAWTIGGEPPEAAANRERIVAMARADRDRLGRAAEDLRQMRPDERDAVRRLHEAVERDESLERTLVEYEAFLTSLQPWEREELRREADPKKRIAQVERLLAERAARESRGRTERFAGRFVEGPVIDGEELDRATSLLAASLDLPESREKELLAVEPGHVRHLRVLKEVESKLRSARPGEPWPGEETVTEILRLLPDGWFKGRMLDEPRGDRGDRERHQGFRRAVAIGFVARSVLAEWHAAAPQVISRELLREAFERLPEERRKKLAGRPPGELVREAIREVLATRTDEVGAFAKDFGEAEELRSKFDPLSGARDDRRGPGPPRGPDGGGRGGDPRGDGRRGGPDWRGGPGRGDRDGGDFEPGDRGTRE